MREYHIITGQKCRDRIELRALACGTDYSVTICGGTRYHVGAIALGCFEPGVEATVRVTGVPGHRDEEVAKWAAGYLATELKCNVSVSAGIHIDNASREEINVLVTNCRKACKALVKEVAEKQ
ncbi:MAG: hypothetical protein WB502_08730 [Thermoactinomyces sp.]